MNTGKPNPINSETSGKNLDQARAMYESTYNGEAFSTELTSSEFGYRYTARGDRDLTLRTSTFFGEIKGTIQPEDEYVVAWLVAGSGALDVGKDETSFILGKPTMFPTGKRFVFEASDFNEHLVHFGAPFLERIAAEHEGVLPGPLHFDHTAASDAKALWRWRNAIRLVAGTVLGGAPAPLLRSEMKRLAATALLDAFPHQGPALPPVLLHPRLERLRTAVEFMHQHAAAPITVTGIAEAADLSLRGLQWAFRSHLDSTPLLYLRDIRLDRVHAELLALGPSDTTVGLIANRWGFTHQGRFAALYQRRFGEYPSVTLHR